MSKDLKKNEFANWTFEIHMILRDAQHTADHLKEWMKDESVDTPLLIGPAKSSIMCEPLGVAGIMGSWNYPYLTTIMPLVAVIAAGNCAVIKPSEMSPHSSLMVKRLVIRHLDSNCYKVVEGAVNVAIKMTSTKFDQIIFTGSTEKGKLVAKAAAENLVPCLLELGGKSPCIIDKGCDVEFAAWKLAFMSFLNSGQTCIRPDYVLIDYSLVNEFVEHMKKAMDKWYDGGKI